MPLSKQCFDFTKQLGGLLAICSAEIIELALEKLHVLGEFLFVDPFSATGQRYDGFPAVALNRPAFDEAFFFKTVHDAGEGPLGNQRDITYVFAGHAIGIAQGKYNTGLGRRQV